MTNETPEKWHVSTNRHPTTRGEQWGSVDAKRHPAGGAGSYPDGMTITWEGARGKANAKRVALVPEMETLLRDLGPAYEAAIRALGHGHEFPQIRAIVERATEILSSIDQEKA